MASFNKVILAGNLTKDPELRYTPKGTAIATIRLAVNRKWKSETGELKEEVSFIDVEAWDKRAEVISQYLKKGRPFLVEGRLKQDTWEDKNTHQKQSRLKVILEGFSFIDSKGADTGAPAAARPAAAPAAAADATAPAEPEASEPEQDDVPF
jgi:single-strand DNA-binding protein